MRKGKRKEPTTPGTLAVPEELAAILAEHAGEGMEDVKILDPLPSVEAARALRRREGPPEAGNRYVARDVETARDPSLPEPERAAAIGRVADWLAARWRVPSGLRGAVRRTAEAMRNAASGAAAADYAKARRRDLPPLLGPRLHAQATRTRERSRRINDAAVKRGVLAAAAYDAMAEDHEPIPVSLRRVVRTAAREERSFLPLTVIYGELTKQQAADFRPLVDGPWAPGQFGWWSLYRDWLVKRAVFHAERRLAEAGELESKERESADEGLEDRLLAATDEERRLARLMAALPAAARRIVRSFDSPLQSYMARALGIDARGRPILLPNQREAFVAWARNDFDRGRAYASLGVSRSAGDKTFKRVEARLRAVGLHGVMA